MGRTDNNRISRDIRKTAHRTDNIPIRRRLDNSLARFRFAWSCRSRSRKELLHDSRTALDQVAPRPDKLLTSTSLREYCVAGPEPDPPVTAMRRFGDPPECETRPLSN